MSDLVTRSDRVKKARLTAEEAYNVFNHPQFEAVDGGFDSANFGRVTSAQYPRVIKLRAKFSF